MIAPLTPLHHRKVSQESARLSRPRQGGFLAIPQDSQFTEHLDLKRASHAKCPITPQRSLSRKLANQ
jgi:hypothetical protein